MNVTEGHEIGSETVNGALLFTSELMYEKLVWLFISFCCCT